MMLSDHDITAPSNGPAAKAQKKFAEACVAFCEQQAILTARKRALEPCVVQERPEPEIGFSGSRCNLDTDALESLCNACHYRATTRPAYKDAIKARYAARRKMMHWFERANASPSDPAAKDAEVRR